MMGVDKHRLRLQLRAKRKELAEDVVRAASAAVCLQVSSLPAYRRAASVATYIASENEITTDGILADAAASARPLFLPRMLEQPALVRWLPGQPLTRGRFGVLEPSAGEPASPPAPAIAFLPLVAFDRAGTRLGRGAGFFDRLLARLQPTPLCVGLAYEFQETTEIPREPWDIPVQFIITERRVIRCDAAAEHDFFEKGNWQ